MKTILTLLVFVFIHSAYTIHGQTTQSDDPIVFREANDPELAKATQKALSKLDYFVKSFQKHSPGSRYFFSLKADFTDNEEHEHMWIHVFKISGDEFSGTLGNDPQIVQNIKYGDTVILKKDQIEDWIIYDAEKDVMEGGYSTKILQHE